MPELPSAIVGPPTYCRISYGNLEVGMWYFLIVDDEERRCKITDIYSDEAVRVETTHVRNVEDGNAGEWIVDQDYLTFQKDDIVDEDEPIKFFKVRD